MRVPTAKEFASGKGYREEVGNGVMNCRGESAGSANIDAFDRDARAGSRNRASAKGFRGGEGSKGGTGVNRNVRNRLVIRFGVVMMVLAISFKCWPRTLLDFLLPLLDDFGKLFLRHGRHRLVLH